MPAEQHTQAPLEQRLWQFLTRTTMARKSEYENCTVQSVQAGGSFDMEE